MSTYNDSKIAPHHLNRQALIYVRQSSMKQVLENTESTARQYALVDTAVTLGWQRDRIDVIDDDLGKSGSSAVHRDGRLVLGLLCRARHKRHTGCGTLHEFDDAMRHTLTLAL